METQTAVLMRHNLSFYSPSFGELSLADMVLRAKIYIEAKPDNLYRLIVGTDSQPASNGRDYIDYISAFVIHRVGLGGIYFWHRTVGQKVFSLRDRIYTEALLSLQLSQILIEDLEDAGLMGYDLEIHVDVGNMGPTRAMITEITGMIRGNGFKVRTKPDSFGASKVADRHT